MNYARVARAVEQAAGSPWASAAALAIIVVWILTGPLFDWSDTWQLVINTGTTIVTFLMVFLIQSTQSRDTAAMHLKLDELIRVNAEARNALMEAEDLDTTTLAAIKRDLQHRK